MAVHSVAPPESPAEPEPQAGMYFAWIPIRDMFTDRYGRAISERKVTELRRNFRRDALGVVLLALRPDGRYAILDGSHRRAATAQEGFDDMAALVYTGLTYAQEAALYLAFATVNRQQARDRFRARVEAGDDEVNAIRGHLQRHGMDVALSGPSVGRVQAVYALDRLMQSQGEAFLGELIDLLYDAWGTQTRAWVTWTVSGFAAFWGRYRTEADRSHLVEVMKNTGPERILAAARAHNEILGATTMQFRAYGLVLKELYDRGRSVNKLSEWPTFPQTQARDAAYDELRGKPFTGTRNTEGRINKRGSTLEREAREKAESEAEWARVQAMIKNGELAPPATDNPSSPGG